MASQHPIPAAVPSAPPVPRRRNFIFFNDHGLRAGWRLGIFSSGIYVGLMLLALAAQKLHLPAKTMASYLVPVRQSIELLILFSIVLLAAWIMSRIERRKMGTYGLPLKKSALSQFFAGYVLWGILPLTLLLLVLRSLHVFYFGEWSLHGIPVLYWGLLWGAAFLLVGLFEEFLFRGYALYTLADGIGYWPATIILATAFAWAHMGNGGETRIGIVGVAFFAVFACVTLWRTGNLWLAVGAHAGWDWAQSFFYGVGDSGFQAPGHLLNPHIAGPDWLSGGSVGPEGSALSLALLAVMTVLFLFIYRSKKPVLVASAEQDQTVSSGS